MKKIIKRFIAYMIDMMVILLITQSLSGIPQINRQLSTYNKHYNNYTNLLEEYSSFRVDLVSAYKDKKLTEKEYQKLTKNHPNYQEDLKKYYKDGNLTTKKYQKLLKQIDQTYQKDYQKVYYQIDKNSIAYLVIYLITVFIYFVGFNMITKGQTLGKKLTRLKIINSNPNHENVSIINYIIRAIILYQPLYYLIRLIGIFTLNQQDYYNITSIVYELQTYLEMVIMLMIVLRTDGRGLHDILAHTKVISLDKNGQKQEEISSNKKKKIIEEPK